MVKVIAHRGLWHRPEERNTIGAFKLALENGFGIETDFRDCNGELVISHDLANVKTIRAKDFFDLCSQYPGANTHAINIKSDGLQLLLTPYLKDWTSDQYFVFDMSVPDSLGYMRLGMNTYTRVSEYEAYQNFGGNASGVWLDCFHSDWYGVQEICHFLNLGNSVAIVSPELHGRDHQKLWEILKSIATSKMPLLLCTDLPLEAKRYFS